MSTSRLTVPLPLTWKSWLKPKALTRVHLKAKVIFEGALNQKLQIEVTRLEEEFSARFEQEISEMLRRLKPSSTTPLVDGWKRTSWLLRTVSVTNSLSRS